MKTPSDAGAAGLVSGNDEGGDFCMGTKKVNVMIIQWAGTRSRWGADLRSCTSSSDMDDPSGSVMFALTNKLSRSLPYSRPFSASSPGMPSKSASWRSRTRRAPIRFMTVLASANFLSRCIFCIGCERIARPRRREREFAVQSLVWCCGYTITHDDAERGYKAL